MLYQNLSLKIHVASNYKGLIFWQSLKDAPNFTGFGVTKYMVFMTSCSLKKFPDRSKYGDIVAYTLRSTGMHLDMGVPSELP
jgi:hypothetical protein